MKQLKESIIKRIKSLQDRYRAPALMTIAIAATIFAIAAQIFPELSSYISSNNVLPYATLIVVLDVALTLDAKQSESRIQVVANQDESIGILMNTVTESRQIDLLEYAGATTLPLIRAIRREGVALRLLVKHPDTLEGMQRQRTITTLDTIVNSVFDSYNGKVEIRCYRLPYSLRGRHFHGKLLELSWLTPDVIRRTTYGSGNPHAVFDLRRGRNNDIKDFFVRTFDDYWSHPETEDAGSVLDRLQNEDPRKANADPNV